MTLETKSRPGPGAFTSSHILLITAIFLATALVLWLDLWGHVELPPPYQGVDAKLTRPGLPRAIADPILYQGSENCRGCHSKREYRRLWNDWTKGGHKDVQCEACHGPAGDHALEDIDPRPKMAVTAELLAKPHVLCMGCHAKIPDRHPSVRQIECEQHLADFQISKDEPDEYEEARQCLGCHDPHRPVKD